MKVIEISSISFSLLLINLIYPTSETWAKQVERCRRGEKLLLFWCISLFANSGFLLINQAPHRRCCCSDLQQIQTALLQAVSWYFSTLTSETVELGWALLLMGPVEAGEGLELLLAKQAAIDCGGPLEALYLRLTLFLFRSCKDLLNNRDHAHFKQGLWKAYQLGFEGQAHCPPLPVLEPAVSSLVSPKCIWRLHSIKYLSAPAAP